MTTPFYAPPDAFRGDAVVLPDDEARHAAQSLRKRAGDEVVVVDGEGGWHRVRLDAVGKGGVSGTVLETRRDVGEPSYRLTVGLALLKNRNRLETFLEKAVELGVSRIVPLKTRRTEKGSFKAKRAERILVAAMKQSGRCRLPRLADPQPLGDVLSENVADHLLICHEAAGPENAFLRVLPADLAGRHLLVLVGPEGGFADEEVEAACERGATLVSLGPRRLRAETAALAAAGAVMHAAHAQAATSPSAADSP